MENSRIGAEILSPPMEEEDAWEDDGPEEEVDLLDQGNRL